MNVPKTTNLDGPGPCWDHHEMGIPVFRCPTGHIGSLREHHQIAADGTVSPSVVCPHEGCTFHEFVKLENWSVYKPDRSEP